MKGGDTTYLRGCGVRVLGRGSDVLKNSLNLGRGHLKGWTSWIRNWRRRREPEIWSTRSINDIFIWAIWVRSIVENINSGSGNWGMKIAIAVLSDL